MSLVTEPDIDVVAEIARTAHVLAFVVIANRRHTDLLEWGQRSTAFGLPAEIQRRLLPPAATCEAGAFTLSGWLEPADDVGGDSFDYSVGRETLHLSMTDAMGHGIDSALGATVCLGSLRNTRRHGGSLLEQVAAANTALVEHATRTDQEGFVTGLFGRLALATGVLSVVNAGHAAPFLASAGGVSALDLPPGLPPGLFADAQYRSVDLALRPGDRLVLVTDGMLERRASGVDLAAVIQDSRALHPREATRFLADRLIAAAGPALDDDATMLVLDWHGDHGRRAHDRSTAGGVEMSRASDA